MTDRKKIPVAKGQLEQEAVAWFFTMRDPDAEEHRAEFNRWLALGAMHRAAYNNVANTYLLSEGMRHETLRAPRLVRDKVKRFSFAASLILAALLVWRFVLPSTVLPDGPSRDMATVATPAATQFVTRLGEVKRIKLSDGSYLILDTDTLVSMNYRSDERELRLEHGRARFEVAHEKRPFVVEAGDSEVIARGTVFDVSVIEPNEVRVHLLRGKVEVRRQGREPGRRAVPLAVLLPGEGVRVADDTRSPPAPPRVEPPSDWPSGSIDFKDSTLGDVVAAANRYSTTKIRLATPDMDRIPVSGVFRVNDPDRLATSLSLLFGLNITRTPGEIILSKSKK